MSDEKVTKGLDKVLNPGQCYNARMQLEKLTNAEDLGTAVKNLAPRALRDFTRWLELRERAEGLHGFRKLVYALCMRNAAEAFFDEVDAVEGGSKK